MNPTVFLHRSRFQVTVLVKYVDSYRHVSWSKTFQSKYQYYHSPVLISLLEPGTLLTVNVLESLRVQRDILSPSVTSKDLSLQVGLVSSPLNKSP